MTTSTLVQRPFPRLAASGANHFEASAIGLGCWQLGSDWGELSEQDALSVLRAAFGQRRHLLRHG